MSPLVSVIIPVYNAERYLTECLDSVCSQTLRDIEIICVDDGSADGSARILREYAARDGRVSVITQPNGGPGTARNSGLAAASGEYAAFIDADDRWKPELLEKAYACASACDADICLFPFAVFDEKHGTTADTQYAGWLPRARCFRPSDCSDRLFQMTAPGPGFRLTRMDLIRKKNLSFLPQHLAEDIYFVFTAMASAGKICRIPDVCVFVRRGADGNLSSALWKYPRETHASLLKIKSRLEDMGLYEPYRETFRVAAISSSEYIFWHVPTDILPADERIRMLADLDLSDKREIIAYHGEEPAAGGIGGKIKTVQRMVNIYGIRYTARYFLQKFRTR